MKARPYVPERGTLTSRTRRWLNDTTKRLRARRGTSTTPLAVTQPHPDGTHTDHVRYLEARTITSPDGWQRVIGPRLEHVGPNRQRRRENRPGHSRRPSLAAANRATDGRQQLRRREAEAVAHKRRLARHGITGPAADLIAAQHVRSHP